MKHIYMVPTLSLAVSLLLQPLISTAQTFEWVKAARSSNETRAEDATTDSEGNLYVCGMFHGTTDFDSTSTTVGPATPQGNGDIFIAKYAPNGDLVWLNTLSGGPATFQFAYDIHITNDSILSITGDYKDGALDLDPSSSSATLPMYGREQAFVASYDLNGNFIAGFSFGSTGEENSADQGSGLAGDGNANLYVVGIYGEGANDFDPGSGLYSLPQVSSGQGFLAKYTIAGDLEWAVGCVPATSEEFLNTKKVLVDPSGRIFVIGSANANTVLYGTNGINHTFSSSGDYVAEYSPSGTIVSVNMVSFSTKRLDELNDSTLVISGNSSLASWDKSGAQNWLTSFPLTNVFAMGMSVANDTCILFSGTPVVMGMINHTGNLRATDSIVGSINTRFTHFDKANSNFYAIGAFKGAVNIHTGDSMVSFNETGASFAQHMFIVKYNIPYPVGVSSLSQQARVLTVFPNPSGDEIKVTGLADGDVVELFNLRGEKLLQEQAAQNRVHLRLSPLPNGLYIVRSQVSGKTATVSVSK